VSKSLFKFPDHLVKEWPEVFEDLYINTMPVAYLEFMQIEFKDGRVWEINIKKQLSNEDPEIIADKILEFLQEYQKEVVNLDFKVNVKKLKKDIKSSSKKLL
jgi:hypothetical protein